MNENVKLHNIKLENVCPAYEAIKIVSVFLYNIYIIIYMGSKV